MSNKLSLLDTLNAAKFVLDQSDLTDDEKTLVLDTIFKFSTGFSAVNFISTYDAECLEDPNKVDEVPNYINFLRSAEIDINNAILLLGYKPDYKSDDETV